jgi:hypothetical protein
MQFSDLALRRGTWLVANCGSFPSEKNCQLVIMAPQDQRADLVEAASAHAIKVHGHEDAPELRQELNEFLVTVEM